MANTTLHITAALVAAVMATGCASKAQPTGTGTSGASSCKTDDDCPDSNACVSSACVAFAVCAHDLQPTFDSIYADVLSKSCGTDGTDCHSSAGGIYSGGLDMSEGDANDPYVALLGKDGTGAFAQNISGKAEDLRRVVPGDPTHSFIIIKLTTKSTGDPQYGHGMPYPAPGSVCPATLSTISDWIQAGAAR